VHSNALFSAEFVKPTYKKSYTREQLEELARIKREWEIYTMLIRRWHLMKDGIDKGLHPDDICYGFVIETLEGSSHDPHEKILHNVEFLLQHNADPNATERDAPDVFYFGQRAAINLAPTYAIAQCLINYKADVFPVGIDKKLNKTLLHNLIYRDDIPAQSVKELIALFCNAGVKPDERNSEDLTPLALLASNPGPRGPSSDYVCLLAETLVKVGTPIDHHFGKKCAQEKERIPKRAAIIDALQKAAYKAEQEVAVIKEKLRERRYPAVVSLLQNLNLSEGSARIIADYDLNPHDYFIHKILVEADAQLKKERQERQEREALEMRIAEQEWP
jgi:hypothetical protein